MVVGSNGNKMGKAVAMGSRRTRAETPFVPSKPMTGSALRLAHAAHLSGKLAHELLIDALDSQDILVLLILSHLDLFFLLPAEDPCTRPCSTSSRVSPTCARSSTGR